MTIFRTHRIKRRRADRRPFFLSTLIIAAILCMSVFVSCHQADSIVTNMPASGEAQKDSVENLFNAFNAHDWPKFASYYNDTASFLDPEFGNSYVKKTRQETIAKYSGMSQLFPDIKDSLTNLFANGESVAAEFISSGTAPDGTRWMLPIVTVFTFRDGKIIRDATYYDIAMPDTAP